MSIRDGGPAFPRKGTRVLIPKELEDDPRLQAIEWIEDGMTLRDYFAAKAMAALIPYSSPGQTDITARTAYKQADAMLAQKANTP